VRIAVMGAGAQGCYVGGLLARAGLDVSFIARGEQLAALAERGLRLESELVGSFSLPVRAVADPATVGAVDLVIFTVKAYDVEGAGQQMRPLLGDRTMVLPLQNGVDTALRLGRFVPPQLILGGISYVSAHLAMPGVVRHLSGARLLFGELAGGDSPRCERLEALLQEAGLAAERRVDIRRDLWEKFMMTCAGSITALARLPLGDVLDYQEGRAFFRGVLEEVAAVARASRVAVSADVVERMMAVVAEYGAQVRTSLAEDLAQGRRLELEALNGALVRQGMERGVPTPLNFAIYAALKPHAAGPPALAAAANDDRSGSS
jgi:2-dehydropantoate 2-reductase